MPHEKIAKTNAARLLDRQGIPYVLHRVAVDESDLSALTVAARLGVDPAMVFKTLVARADRAGGRLREPPRGAGPSGGGAAADRLYARRLFTAGGQKGLSRPH